jgi:hypothetical protein
VNARHRRRPASNFETLSAALNTPYALPIATIDSTTQQTNFGKAFVTNLDDVVDQLVDHALRIRRGRLAPLRPDLRAVGGWPLAVGGCGGWIDGGWCATG